MKSFYTLLTALLLTATCFGQSGWEQLENHPTGGIARAFSFAIEGKVYVGGGERSSGAATQTFRAYDVSTNTWTSKADLPGPPRRNACAFQINGIGYAGTGFDGAGHLSDFWKYVPNDDSWVQISDFPGGKRSHVLAISSGTKAYLLTGGRSFDNTFFSDMWEFDSESEEWTQLEDFPGLPRWRAFGWVIDQKLYVGGGARYPNDGFRDFYCFDLGTLSWDETVRPDCPTRGTIGGLSFTLAGKGYFGGGTSNIEVGFNRMDKSIYAYDPATNTWARDDEFVGPERILGVSEVVDGKALVGLGWNYEFGRYYSDFYAFEPALSTSTSFAGQLSLRAYPNPVSSTKLSIQGDFLDGSDLHILVTDIRGVVQPLSSGKIYRAGGGLVQVDLDHLPPGAYVLHIVQRGERTPVRFIKQ